MGQVRINFRSKELKILLIGTCCENDACIYVYEHKKKQIVILGLCVEWDNAEDSVRGTSR